MLLWLAAKLLQPESASNAHDAGRPDFPETKSSAEAPDAGHPAASDKLAVQPLLILVACAWPGAALGMYDTLCRLEIPSIQS